MRHAKNGVVKIEDTTMDYITFGKGKRNLVIILGLGDGLRTVKGTAHAFAWAYRRLRHDFKVYVFSRRNKLIEGYTTRDMAQDVVYAMKHFHIHQADILGISLGGMIAQYVALDYPELVHRLVLTVTMARPNDTVYAVVGQWITMARGKDYKGIIRDTAKKSYSFAYLKHHRLWLPLLGIFGKPKDFNRFLVQAQAALTHNTYEMLPNVICPVLVIGGECDQIVSANASREIASRIANCQLYMYSDLGHSAYDEAKDFLSRVMNFLLEDED